MTNGTWLQLLSLKSMWLEIPMTCSTPLNQLKTKLSQSARELFLFLAHEQKPEIKAGINGNQRDG
jgi:hypothetical protein